MSHYKVSFDNINYISHHEQQQKYFKNIYKNTELVEYCYYYCCLFSIFVCVTCNLFFLHCKECPHKDSKMRTF